VPTKPEPVPAWYFPLLGVFAAIAIANTGFSLYSTSVQNQILMLFSNVVFGSLAGALLGLAILRYRRAVRTAAPPTS